MPSGSIQTTDATVVTAFTGTPIDGGGCAVTAEILSKKADGSQIARYVLEFAVRRNGSTATLVAVNRVVEIEDDPAWHADIDVSGADFRVRVTGAAGTTIDWIVDINVREL